VCDTLIRIGAPTILASLLPLVWTLEWRARVDLFWTNMVWGRWPTLKVLLDADVVDLRTSACRIVTESTMKRWLIAFNVHSGIDDERFGSMVRGIMTHPKAANTDFFRLWLDELVANFRGVGGDSYSTALQIVLITGQKHAGLCSMCSFYHDFHARMFHICHCDENNDDDNREGPEKRLKTDDEEPT